MSHKRVKNLAADDFDDDYDDYDEEEDADALTEDDKAQLQAGAAEVRIALGPDFQTTDTEIQEALWHYYYDVGKVVTYLKSELKHPRYQRRLKLIPRSQTNENRRLQARARRVKHMVS